MSSNLYNVLSGIINNERGIITGLQNVKGAADRLNGIIVTSGDGTGFLADNGTYVNVGSQNLAPVVNGKIPAEYLPSYVDDVIEGYYRSNAFYATASGGSPMTGEAGKLYLDLTSNKNELYRWSGSAYVKVSGLNGDDLLAINNKINYVSGVVSGIHVNNSTITFKNGSTSLGTLTTNQSSAGTVQLSGLVPTVGAGVITLKNGTKTSANTFTANETGAKSVDIAALFSGYATGTINNKTVTFKNGSATLGTLSTNQASNSEIQLSSMLNGIATTSNIPTVNDVTISFKNGALTAADTFTTNASSAKAIQLSGILSGLALKSSIPTVNNKTVTFKNGSTTIGTLSTNQSAASEINFSSEFDKKQNVINSSNKLAYSNISGTPTIPTVNNNTITFKNGSTSIDSFTLNQNSDKTINLSGEFNKKQDVIDTSHKLSYSLISSQPTIPTVYNKTVTFKNGSTTLGTLSTNQSANSEIQLSSLITTANGAIGDGTISVKNGSTAIGSFTVNQSGNTEINLSGEFNKKQNVINSSNKLAYSNISGTPTIPTVNNKTITIKNGSTTISSFTLNQTTDATIDFGTEFNKKQNVINSSNKLAYSNISGTPTIPTVNNNTITIKNGSTTIDSFTLNQASDKTINLSAEFNKKQDVIDSSHKLSYSLLTGTPTIPAAAGAGAITLKNSVNSASATSFSANESSAKTIELSGLFAGYSRATVGTASITLKNSVNNKSATSFNVNETSNKTIEMSGLFDNYAKADKVEADLGFLSGQIDGLNAQSNPEGTIAAFAAISGNIVTAANNMSNGYFVTSNGTAKTVEGKTYSRVTSISAPTDTQIPTAKAVSGLVSGMLAVSGRIVANAVKSTDGTGTTAGQLIISTGTTRDIKNSSISSEKLVQSDGTGTTSGKVVVTTTTGNKILSSDITAANIVTTANAFAGTSYFVMAAGTARAVEGKTVTKSTSVTSSSTDNQIPTAKAVYTEVNKKQNSITSTAKLDYSLLSGTPTIPAAAGAGTITIKNGTASGDTFTANEGSAKTVQLSALWAGYAKSTEIKNSTITLKNGATTIDSFTLNASSGKDIQLSSLVTQAPNVGAGVITLKNGTKTGETFNVNETADKVVQLSALFSGYATGTIGAGTITLKNGSKTSANTFTANETGAKSVDIAALFDGYATGTSLTANALIVGNGNSTIKTNGLTILSSATTWAGNDTTVPTAKSVHNRFAAVPTAFGSSAQNEIVVVNANSSREVKTSGVKVLSSATSWSSSDAYVPTAKSVSSYVASQLPTVGTGTLTVKDTQANISDTFSANATGNKTIELSGMFAKRECLSAVFPTGATPTVTANQWAILTASATTGITLGTGTSGAFIKVTVTSAAINGTQVNISGTITGQNGATWGSIATTSNPLKVDIPETLTFVHNGSAWLLVESSRL